MPKLEYRASLASLMASQNIAKEMSEKDRGDLGQAAKLGYETDKASRAEWERKTAASMKLALQVAETKTFPWPNCSNIKFPLITVASLHFHARAYPAIVPSSGIVNCAPIGYAPPQEEIDRANRVGAHMSYQIQNETSWEAETDRALIILPIVGCAFKKVDYDPVQRRRINRLVLAQNLVVDYYTVDLKTSPRVSEYFTLTRNEVTEKVRAKIWLEPDELADGQAKTTVTNPPHGPLEAVKDKVQGTTPPTTDTNPTTLHFIEQHLWLDLDGDGYDEPYIATFDRDTGFLRSVRARFIPSCITYERDADGKLTNRVACIYPICYYVKLPFIPSPDGGFYDMGFGSFLSASNEAVNTAINQLFDAGTMRTLGGGFLGRGMRIKKGSSTFEPMEWKTVDSVGDDISKNIYPLPVGEPSKVLLDLLIFLIQYVERIASANEVQTGELPGSNNKAEAFRIADTNGARIFAAIFRRIWRAIGEEYEMFHALNKRFPPSLDYKNDGKWFQIKDGDYSGEKFALQCAANPDAVTDLQRKEQALLVFQTAQTIPGHKMVKVTRRLYQAFNVRDIDEVLPDQEVPPPPNAQLIQAQARAQEAEAKVAKTRAEMLDKQIKMYLEAEKLTAEIFVLYAQADKLKAEADAVGVGQQLAAINLQISAMKEKREGLFGLLEILKDAIAPLNQGESSGGTTGSGGNGGTTTRAGTSGAASGTNAGAGIPRVATAASDAAILPDAGAEAA